MAVCCTMSDQTANKIVQALKDHTFKLVGPPQRLHSDHLRNFESQILSELCKAFGVNKSQTTYHLMGDRLLEWMNRSILNLLCSLLEKEGTGKNTYSYSYICMEQQNMQQPASHRMKICLGQTHHH